MLLQSYEKLIQKLPATLHTEMCLASSVPAVKLVHRHMPAVTTLELILSGDHAVFQLF